MKRSVIALCVLTMLVLAAPVGCERPADKRRKPLKSTQLKIAPEKSATMKPTGKQTQDARKTCLLCLQSMRKGISALIRKYPDELAHLGEGVLDEKVLSLHFPVRDPKKKPIRTGGRGQPTLPEKDGLFVRLVLPVPKDASVFPHYWPYCDVGFRWYWLWAGSFAKAHNEVWKLLQESLRPLDELENATIAADLKQRSVKPFVFRGQPGLRVTIKVSSVPNVNGVHVVEVYEENQTDTVIALYPGYGVVVGAPRQPKRSLFFGGRAMRGKDPFVYLKPGERRKTAEISAGRLRAGRYRLRLVWLHPHAGWTDFTPTYMDGAPAYHKVKNAWVGTAVSNEVEVKVDRPRRS